MGLVIISYEPVVMTYDLYFVIALSSLVREETDEEDLLSPPRRALSPLPWH